MHRVDADDELRAAILAATANGFDFNRNEFESLEAFATELFNSDAVINVLEA